MPLTDLSLAECLAYRPVVPEPPDLDAFWAATLEGDRSTADGEAGSRFVPVGTGLSLVETFDVAFAGFGGEEVRGWLHLPAGTSAPLPCVVQFQGYGEGRGLAWQQQFWAVAGYAHFVMDTRGQGWGSLPGATPDGAGRAAGEPSPITWGLRSPHDYYYRRVFADAVRACEVVAGHPMVDAGAVVVAGASQGGGIALAAAALVPGLRGAMVDVPFLADVRRAVDICGVPPYADLATVLRHRPWTAEAALRTLGYFDVAALASRASAPALFSVAMMDPVCPPSTCFAAYHRYGGPKQLRVYEFADHAGGEATHLGEQVGWLASLLGGPSSGSSGEDDLQTSRGGDLG